MPQYKVQIYNDESGMLHTQRTVYAADEESAKAHALEQAETDAGYRTDQNQAAVPRFRTAVSEVQE